MNRLFLHLIAVIFLMSSAVPAQNAGFDLLQTPPGTSINLRSIGLGVVPLQGVPIMDRLGNTDTIMERTQTAPKGGGIVGVIVRAMLLKSTHSVTFTGQAVDVYVTVNNSVGAISGAVLPHPDPLEGSGGAMTIRTDGTFDSKIIINADVILVKAGASVANPANYLGHLAAPVESLSSLNSSWSPKSPSDYPSNPSYPSGGFYPLAVRNSSHSFAPASCPAPNPAHPVPSSAPVVTTTCKPVT